MIRLGMYLQSARENKNQTKLKIYSYKKKIAKKSLKMVPKNNLHKREEVA